MAIKIGIMGFGRIGRNIFRILNNQTEIEVVAIADIVDAEALGYLLRFDTVFGKFPDAIFVKNSSLFIRGKEIKVIKAKEPKDCTWKDLGVDVVIDSSNKYKTRAALAQHLEQGAKKVIVTAPTKFEEVDFTLIRGVNDQELTSSQHILSSGSITSNCAALILKVLDEAYGVQSGLMNTVHAYTNAQRLADVPHNELRLSRAAAENIIPAESKVHLSIEHLFPKLQGKFDTIAMNVPVPNGSCIDLVCNLEKEVTVESINEVMKSAAGAQAYKGLIEYTDEPIVSSDVIENTHSAVFDGQATQVLDNKLVKTLTWFDNGWGYAHRVVEIVKMLKEIRAV